jgi:cyclophilin family peptidyl-prolyl cis-trans isomerase/HEAT repeat protein
MRRAFWILMTIALASQFGCMPFEDSPLTEVNLNARDPLFQKIADFQDRQNLDSLYAYFQHPDPTYRYLSARAFGSIKATATLDSLAVLLQDDVDAVRSMAAFSIGQVGTDAALPLLLDAFVAEDTAGLFKRTNRAILEAIGKCGKEEHLAFMSTTTTYEPTDTFLLEGQAWGIYRFALRNLTLPEGTARMVSLATDLTYPLSVRVIAANYLYRARAIKLKDHAEALIPAFRTEQDARVRMALAVALGKVGTEAAQNALLAQFQEEQDYRVQCNILRALSNFPYEEVQETVREALRHANFHVSSRAAQYFLENGTPDEAVTYWKAGQDTIYWQASITMHGAAMRHLPAYRNDMRNPINYALRNKFYTMESAYQKMAVLDALAEFGWNYRFIHREAQKLESGTVMTGALNALSKITSSQDFRSYFGGSYAKVARDIGIYYLQAIRSGDPAHVAVAAGALRNAPFPYVNFIPADSLQVLEEVLTQLELPKETETYYELAQAIAVLNGEEPKPKATPAFNHPINFELISDLTEQPKATITTSKGAITARLLPTEAPGTVANFIQLARDGFFEDKNFHRVVPNFVIQGGCPRGDGYGSLDYSIRSELTPLHYDEQGYIGMASAGNHTEGTQFFITHSPTPHLDGNYTIFAKVIEGMEVVHQIGVGDNIEQVRINR